jgi:hypothetical protein
MQCLELTVVSRLFTDIVSSYLSPYTSRSILSKVGHQPSECLDHQSKTGLLCIWLLSSIILCKYFLWLCLFQCLHIQPIFISLLRCTEYSINHFYIVRHSTCGVKNIESSYMYPNSNTYLNYIFKVMYNLDWWTAPKYPLIS